ncbi:MAG: hypothetical protein LBH81_02385 [Rickettsiales bacterium]|jgi:hypothetical protein|nr:hypothetical protein [Rickettsiales bacterium]
MKNQRGASLVEVLMMVAIFMGLLPMIYKQINRREETRVAIAESRKLAEARDALMRYIEANEKKLSAHRGGAVFQVHPRDLGPFGFDGAAKNIRARVIRVSDNLGHSYLQGIVVSELPDTTPLRTRHVAMEGGEGAGFVSGNQLYGSFGTWQQSLAMWNVSSRGDALAAQTPVFWKTGDWLYRVDSGRAFDSAMLTDLDMGGNDINEIGMMNAGSVRVAERMKVEWAEADNISFAENVSLDKEFSVSGEANVMGDLASDGGDITVGGNLLLGNVGRFRGVEANRMKVGNLVLEGISPPQDGAQGVLSIGQHLGLSNGSVAAEVVNVGYAGMVATSLTAASGMVDSADPSYYWDFAEKDAALRDVMLSDMGRIMRAVIKSENAKGAGTEMDKALSPVASNANATAADYLRALQTAIGKVEQKYRELGLE